MIEENDNKFVDFSKYCADCKHHNKPDYKKPCNECLENPALPGTEVPFKFERKE